MPSNLYLFAYSIGKVLLSTGLGPALIWILLLEAYMKLTLESTSKVVSISQRTSSAMESSIQARVWEGTTERGVRVIALIPRLAVKNGQDVSQFEEELQEQKPPSVEAQEAFPLRMVL